MGLRLVNGILCLSAFLGVGEAITESIVIFVRTFLFLTCEVFRAHEIHKTRMVGVM